MVSEPVQYSVAFVGGLFSFFTPCVLPLIPAYFTFITGMSLKDLTENINSDIRKKIFLSTLFFICGFSFIFILLGASVSFFGGLVSKYNYIFRIIGGIIIIILGIHITGIFRLKGLDFEKRIQLRKKPLHFFGAFVVGMAFASGWSPCIGPILGSILIIAGNMKTVINGIILLGIYSAGLAIPFLIISVFINFIIVFIKKANKMIKYINIISGILLIIIGIMLGFDKLSFLVIL